MSAPGDHCGAFEITYPGTGYHLRVIATDGLGGAFSDVWEHVSVSLRNRCPNWAEMSFIKDLFWDETETVMQLHVPKADHKNCHPYCLHLWKPRDLVIPRPPALAVAP